MVAVNDVSKSPLFDSSVDQGTGFVTKSIAAVPIFNGHSDVIGCTEMLNKEGDAPFTDSDLKIIELFNFFSGLAIDHLKLADQARSSDEKLSNLLSGAGDLLRETDGVKRISLVVHFARLSTKGNRSAFYIEQSSLLTMIASDGSPLLPALSTTINSLRAVLSRGSPTINNGFVSSEIVGDTNSEKCSAILFPVRSIAHEVSGLLIILADAPNFFAAHDLEVTAPFAAFCALGYANFRLSTQLNELSSSSESEKWITVEEAGRFCVPAALVLSDKEKATVRSMDCFSLDFQGIGHFKELFYFFHAFDLFECFHISAERFFRFLSLVSARYTSAPYHNWTHACDVTQCLFYMATVGHVTDSYEAWEIFALLIAGICHDTNHQGLNNIYHLKAETPFGILYKGQSVMEVHHAHEAIVILSRPDVALFESFDGVRLKSLWRLFINIILATDMAKHFELVKQAKEALDAEAFDFANPSMRLLGIQLLIKVADISNVSRPFAIADKWCDILNQEFFRQGDLEKSSGIGLTSPLNDRETSNKPKSQIGFYNFICLPLYTAVARLYPPLEIMVEAVRTNLQEWTQLSQS
jgi:3',5'-cyclic-nucleotide phosphodiesterase